MSVIECSKCSDAVYVTKRNLVLPFVCAACDEIPLAPVKWTDAVIEQSHDYVATNERIWDGSSIPMNYDTPETDTALISDLKEQLLDTREFLDGFAEAAREDRAELIRQAEDAEEFAQSEIRSLQQIVVGKNNDIEYLEGLVSENQSRSIFWNEKWIALRDKFWASEKANAVLREEIAYETERHDYWKKSWVNVSSRFISHQIAAARPWYVKLWGYVIRQNDLWKRA